MDIIMPPKYSTSEEKFHWYHPVHGKEYCTQHELYTKYKLDRRPVNNVARGRKKSVAGWKIKK